MQLIVVVVLPTARSTRLSKGVTVEFLQAFGFRYLQMYLQ